MTESEHIERHKMLHKSFDELLADYIKHTSRSLSGTTLMEFMEWSYEQTVHPSED
jgi:hypothetical protein